MNGSSPGLSMSFDFDQWSISHSQFVSIFGRPRMSKLSVKIRMALSDFA